MLTVIALLVGLGVGAVSTAVWLRASSQSALRRSEEERRRLVADAEREAETIRREALVEAREGAVKLRAEVESEVQDRRVEIAKVEERIAQREAELDQKLIEVTRREQGLGDREVHLKQLQDEQKEARDRVLHELERVSGMTLGEAKSAMFERSQDLVRHELARSVRQMEEEARGEARRRARALVADALQRVAASHTAETTVTVVELASDDMKGRIIGREGRNIRALEHLTGVDVIVDDTPHAVVLSSFDGIRREIAKLTLEKRGVGEEFGAVHREMGSETNSVNCTEFVSDPIFSRARGRRRRGARRPRAADPPRVARQAPPATARNTAR